ncbi:MAG: c-type cytochrome [Acidimicrobiia bacterium]|nr:c-type cytochrome [Acidimicrobiia bacterium]
MKRLLSLVFVVATTALIAQQPDQQVEWRYWGGDLAGTKYSALTDINPQNLSRLELAWQWKHWETPLDEYKTIPGFFESTPLMIDGVLYVTTPYNSVAALDAATGKELWRYDGEAYKLGQVLSGSGFKHRGVAFWRDGNQTRIFLNSRSKLVSLDAQTGRLVPSFGDRGVLALTESPHLSQSSPPMVYGNLVIIGSQIPDRLIGREEVGEVQAFDARSGRLVWTFSVVPRSAADPAAATWENESWRNGSHANVWAPMALDEARGLLYLPTSTPNNDYYGGARPGANLYAESLVCLDAATGKVRWHFQTTHHGIWDYDIPAQPNLVTITVDGTRIDAVAQVTKQGFTFVFDRVTGRPVWPIEERSVPTDTDIPGEKVYPTQPFPSKPPAFVTQGITLDDANNLTPEIRRMAQEVMKQYRTGPLYTPPMLNGTLQLPELYGGANWGGASFDPELGYLYVRANHSLGLNNGGRNPVAEKNAGPDGAQYARAAPTLPGGIPLISPPYSLLTAIDLNRGEIAWQSPLGEGNPSVRNHPLLKGVALPARLGSNTNRGGTLVTRSGLVFIGGGDGYFYAFDKRTGQEVWRTTIPYNNVANPMTYRTRAGKQFIVVASGAGADNALLAFAVKEDAAPPPQGQAAYTRACAACHGPAGRGLAGPPLVPFAKSPDEVLAIVREGRGEMPPTGPATLSDDQVRQIVSYLAALN